MRECVSEGVCERVCECEDVCERECGCVRESERVCECERVCVWCVDQESALTMRTCQTSDIMRPTMQQHDEFRLFGAPIVHRDFEVFVGCALSRRGVGLDGKAYVQCLNGRDRAASWREKE